jgi:hypothetical protein
LSNNLRWNKIQSTCKKCFCIEETIGAAKKAIKQHQQKFDAIIQ